MLPYYTPEKAGPYTHKQINRKDNFHKCNYNDKEKQDNKEMGVRRDVLARIAREDLSRNTI